jgi:dTDP-4-dehydrorhamnose 3,5-epimerase|tara:strand:+ start:781 stop:1317 length:537 start_codon:yes stop_codon:yes gene_type:complete
MKIVSTKFKGLKIIKQKKNEDSRGSLREIHNQKIVNYKNFIFEYATTSKKNVLRGFHFQYKYQQAKYVNVLKGKILDVVIDLRKNSKTFGKTFKIILSDKNCLSLYIPEGFAHSYFSYEKYNIIYYKLSNYYQPKFEDGIIWNDKEFKLKWPTKNPKVSIKDKKLGTFQEFIKKHKNL